MAIVIVSRADWGARSPKSRSEISLPTARLWIHHTAGSERGAAGMRSIQNTHMDDPKFKFGDIGYSFVVDNADGTSSRAAAPASRGPTPRATTPSRMRSV